ncbi:MAG: rubrerythrin family protein [Phycisphaerae bacterium]|nr:rubrerythrin family protein [Phycisphaerae bacterium]
MSTSENLQEAFAGESQANRKYLAFAERAEKEGFVEVARLFRAAAEAEAIHARSHLRAMKAVQSTRENLEAAVHGEEFEFQQMYPQYIEAARKEGNDAALMAFKNAMAVEQVHCSLYLQALETIKQGEDMPRHRIFVCEVCGNTMLDRTLDKCPVCGAGEAKFIEIE